MLRIVIVDDEALIREGLVKMISKESERFVIAGSFSNGQDVLDFIASEDIDLVITDIRMPLVDGLELISEIKSIRPEIRCIIMSGFTDFEYARQALRSSAVDYLLKPINKKQLFELLYTLDNERMSSQEKEQQYRLGLLLSYIKTTPSLCFQLPELLLPHPYFAIFTLKGSDMPALRSTLRMIAQQAHCAFDTIDVGDQTLSIVCYFANEPKPEELLHFAEEFRAFPIPGVLHVGASPAYNSPILLKKAFTEAKRACNHGIYTNNSWSFIHYCDAFSPGQDIIELFVNYREAIVQNLQILNIPQLTSHLESLFDELKINKTDLSSILHLCRLIEEQALTELHEWGKYYNESAAQQLEDRIQACYTFDEIKRLFIREMSDTLKEIRSCRLAQAGKSVETVKRWIMEHYKEPAELGLLANMVYLTPSYLSKLFKNETGMTITDYLIEIRIKKAKHLLKESAEMKIHEIGCEVGYPDPAYFNKLFKRMVGITPNEYKRISQ
ncbi:putative response regulatory protein [compost metagenome]